MTEFEQAFLERHGEIVLMPLVENWERSKGIRHEEAPSFEARWQTFIKETSYALAA